MFSCLRLHFSTLTRDTQTIEVSIDPPTYNGPSHPPDYIEISDTEPDAAESDDEVAIVSFGPGPSGSTPANPQARDDTDIVDIEPDPESDEDFEPNPESDEDIELDPKNDKDIGVRFSPPSPNTVPYRQQTKEPDTGQTAQAGVKGIKVERR